MDQEKRNSMSLSGAGVSNGGVYDKVSISGAAKINGNLDCNSFSSSGASKIEGSVKALKVGISGSTKINGNLEAEEIKLSGAANINGDLIGKQISISGSSNIKGSLKGEAIKISGAAKIQNDCEGEEFKASGIFTIGGLLNAEYIRIKLGGECKVTEIGGENIEVTKGGENFLNLPDIIKSLFNKTTDSLIVETIEGDNIKLEATFAKVVRGNNVTLGKGSRIDLVEYTGELNILEDVVVKEQRKIN